MAKARKKPASKNIIKKSGQLTVVGWCLECKIEWNGSATPLQATRHFNDTGHSIRVEQQTYWERHRKN